MKILSVLTLSMLMAFGGAQASVLGIAAKTAGQLFDAKKGRAAAKAVRGVLKNLDGFKSAAVRSATIKRVIKAEKGIRKKVGRAFGKKAKDVTPADIVAYVEGRNLHPEYLKIAKEMADEETSLSPKQLVKRFEGIEKLYGRLLDQIVICNRCVGNVGEGLQSEVKGSYKKVFFRGDRGLINGFESGPLRNYSDAKQVMAKKFGISEDAVDDLGAELVDAYTLVLHRSTYGSGTGRDIANEMINFIGDEIGKIDLLPILLEQKFGKKGRENFLEVLKKANDLVKKGKSKKEAFKTAMADVGSGGKNGSRKWRRISKQMDEMYKNGCFGFKG